MRNRRHPPVPGVKPSLGRIERAAQVARCSGGRYPLPKDMQGRGSAREQIRRGLAIAILVSLGDTGDSPAGLHLVQFAMGQSGGRRHNREGRGRSADPKILSDGAFRRIAERGRSPHAACLGVPCADLRGLHPLIQIGSAEMLLDGAVRLAGVAAAADVWVTLKVWPDMIHAWQLFYQQLRDVAPLPVWVRSSVRISAEWHPAR